jgi:MFS family permease
MSDAPAVARPSARVLRGWLTSEAISLTGTRVSMVAIPWLVLTSTGSATATGFIALCEMLPYVVAKAASGPVIDRLGARRVCVAADLASLVVVGAVPLLHLLDLLTLPVLATLVALAGMLRGPGDGAKHALVPEVVRLSGVSLERATGLSGAVERLASTLGAALAGVLVAAVGPATALLIDAVSFGASAAVLLVFVPPRRRPPADGDSGPDAHYLRQLRDGARFLRREPVLLGITVMVAATNLLDAGYVAVLAPVWAEETGGGAQAVGVLLGVFSAAAVAGSVLASRFAERLPRFRIYVAAFLVCGMPRFAVMAYDVAYDVPVWWVLGVACVGGFGAGFINPILGAVFFERIPEPLVGRVTTLSGSLAWAGMPFGGLLAGLLVSGPGTVAALLVLGAAYLAATMAPLLVPRFRDFDRAPAPPGDPSPGSAQVGEPEGDLARG